MLGDPVCNPEAFRAEAAWQPCCAACGRVKGGWHAHHVVDKRILQDRCGLSGDELYDTRNALRLCQEVGSAEVRCHFQHENYARLVRTRELTDDNIAYAFEVLGAYAFDYLRSEYDDSEPDERIVRHLATLEAA